MSYSSKQDQQIQSPVTRQVKAVGWDGRNQPMLRYADEMHLPDHLRSVVAR